MSADHLPSRLPRSGARADPGHREATAREIGRRLRLAAALDAVDQLDFSREEALIVASYLDPQAGVPGVPPHKAPPGALIMGPGPGADREPAPLPPGAPTMTGAHVTGYLILAVFMAVSALVGYLLGGGGR